MKLFGSWSKPFDPTRRTILQGGVAAAMIVPATSLMHISSKFLMPEPVKLVPFDIESRQPLHANWLTSLKPGDVINVNGKQHMVTETMMNGGPDQFTSITIKSEQMVMGDVQVVGSIRTDYSQFVNRIHDKIVHPSLIDEGNNQTLRFRQFDLENKPTFINQRVVGDILTTPVLVSTQEKFSISVDLDGDFPRPEFSRRTETIDYTQWDGYTGGVNFGATEWPPDTNIMRRK